MNYIENKIAFNSVDRIPLFLIILSPSVRLMIPSVNSLVLFVIIPILFIWAFFKYRKCAKQRCIYYYVFLILWFMFTVLTSTDFLSSLSYVKTLLGGFLASVIMYLMASSKIKNGIYITIAYPLLLLTTIWYLWQAGLLINLDINNERLDDDYVNANDLAYYLFYVSASLYLFFYYFRLNKALFIFFYGLLVVGSIWLSLITASRQILLVVIPYIVLCLLFLLFEEKKIRFWRVFFVILLSTSLIIAVLPSVQNIFMGSLIEARMDSAVKEDIRVELLKEAINVGLDHPIVGVGPGNMINFSKHHAFSHSSFTELFSTSGFPALIIYVIMICSMAVINRIRYKKTHKRVFAFIYLTSITWILYNILYVFYSSLWLISFYFLLMGISDSLYRNLQSVNRNLVDNECCL